MAEARRFVESRRSWIEKHRARRAEGAGSGTHWSAGTVILVRGERVALEVGRWHGRPFAAFAGERVFIADGGVNLRRPVEARLRALAAAELPERTRELARRHGIDIGTVRVRNQSSRWGSCSERGGISLNWRLVQVPVDVRDYVILHELMHRREMNHSARFWAWVAAACPGWREAKAWLVKHAADVGM